MNNRIQDLTFKSGAKLYSDPLKRQVTGVSMSFESVEKFAELIVQECTDILATYRVQFDDGFEYNGVHPIQAIYKHFGLVEVEK